MRKLWRRTPLRYRLAVLLAAGLAVLLTLFSSGLFLATRAYVLWQAEQNLRAQGNAALAAGLPPGGERRSLQTLADRLVDARTSVVVYDSSGTRVVRGSGQNNGPQPPRLRPNRVARVANQERGPRLIASAPNGTRNLVVLLPIGDAAGSAVLQLATPLRPINEFLLSFGRYLILATLAAALVGALLGMWGINQALRPLSALVTASDRVAGGDWSARLTLAPDGEWSRVCHAFNLMVSRVGEQFTAQQRFLADAAHELRTPLTAIGGSIELLQMGAIAGQPEAQRRVLQSAGNEIDRLGRLVNNLLLLQTLDGTEAAHTALDLRQLALDVVAQIELAAPDHLFRTALPGPLPVRGDGDQLRQVLINLLTNAYTYTPAGGTITVSGRRDASGVCLAVGDTGVGIAPEELARVGERLYRVDRARARGSGGFGLGLAIVNSIVAAHDGTVAFSSTPGQGTTVTLHFPPDL